MANIQSARKRARQTIKRTERNKTWRTRARTSVRKVEEALASGDFEVAAMALRNAESELARAGQRHVIHKRTASRKVARLSAQVNALKG